MELVLNELRPFMTQVDMSGWILSLPPKCRVSLRFAFRSLQMLGQPVYRHLEFRSGPQ